jgi:aryl-alcohol dehydrogenase-like predicted oxidoreductase
MSMRYKLLGHTGLRVSELCLGAMTLDDRSRIELGFPYDFGGGRLAHGDTRALIDDHRRAALAAPSDGGGKNG